MHREDHGQLPRLDAQDGLQEGGGRFCPRTSDDSRNGSSKGPCLVSVARAMHAWPLRISTYGLCSASRRRCSRPESEGSGIASHDTLGL